MMGQMTVALARFLYTNRVDYKIRPAVIVSNNKFNQAHAFFWACPITTKSSLKEYELEISKSEFNGTLDAQSFIRTDSMTSMEKSLFFKEIGSISPALFEKLKREIGKNF